MEYLVRLMRVLALTLFLFFVVSCQAQESSLHVDPPVVIGETASSQDVADEPTTETQVAEEPVEAEVEESAAEDALAEENDKADDVSASEGVTGTTGLYLPAAVKDYPPSAPPAPNIFGTQMSRNHVNNPTVLQKITQNANQASLSWVRYEGIRWYEVEENPGDRNWPESLGDTIIAFNAQKLTPMIVVQGTPSWAQKVPGSFCGPVKEESLDEFATFMSDLVTRYSAAPYYVKHWELGNEIDVDASLVGPDSVFGCWGDQTDPYYGGGYYAQMLKQVYPAMKAADPEAQLVFGGLLLDCDHTNPPETQADGCLPSKFLEGVLRNDGGDYFDILAYHAYMYWAPGVFDLDLLFRKWRHRGGALLGKLNFLEEVLAQYNVNKPIIMNEGGLLCFPTTQETCTNLKSDFRNSQANYAIRLYTRTGATSLIGSVWYTLDHPGWRDGALLDANQDPRPALKAIEFLGSKLKNATYTQTLASVEADGYEGYEYTNGNMTYRIYWTNDETTVTVQLPAGAKAYDKLGTDVTPNGTPLTVGFEPVIVEISN